MDSNQTSMATWPFNSSTLNSTVFPSTQSVQPHFDTHLSFVQTVLLLLIACIALIENGMVCVAILSHRRLRKKLTYVFVVSLTMTQIYIACVVLPMHCFTRLHTSYGFFVAFGVMAYIANLCAITVERYIAIKIALRYHQFMTYTKAVKAAITCWIVSAIFEIMPVAWLQAENAALYHRIYLTFTLVLVFVLPLIFIVGAYTIIFLEIRGISRREKHSGLSFQMDNRGVSFKTESIDDSRLMDSPLPPRHMNGNNNLSDSMVEIDLSTSVGQDGFLKPEHESRRFKIPKFPRSNSPSKNKLSSDSQASPMVGRKSPGRSPGRSPSRFSARGSWRSIRSIEFRLPKLKIQREGKIALVFVIIAVTYMTTWLPVLYMTFLVVLNLPQYEPPHMSDVSIFLLAVNCLVDPIVYGICLSDIRHQMVFILSKCLPKSCCKSL